MNKVHPRNPLKSLRTVDRCQDLRVYMQEMTRQLDEMGVGPVEFALIDTALGYDVTGLDGYEYHSTDAGLVLGSFHDILAEIVAEASRRDVRFTGYHADHGLLGCETDYAFRYHTTGELPRTEDECLADGYLSSELELGRLLAVEQDVRDLDLRFGVVVNANHQCHRVPDIGLKGDYPEGSVAAAESVRGRTMVYLSELLGQLASVPDQFIFQTWFRYPETKLPETEPLSYSGIALSLYRRAAPERAEVGFFRVYAAIFQVSEDRPEDYCVFTSWRRYLDAGGDPTLSRVTSYAAQPSLQHFTGPCP
jgi:hypothetical protein